MTGTRIIDRFGPPEPWVERAVCRVEQVEDIIITDAYERQSVAWRVVEEVDPSIRFGPQGPHVAALIARAREITGDEVEKFNAARESARDAARESARDAVWNAVRKSAWFAASKAAGVAGRESAWIAASESAWVAASTAARVTASDAAVRSGVFLPRPRP